MRSDLKGLGRNLFVCLERQCRRCDDEEFDCAVPEDCPYDICHALETRKMGQVWTGGRQTGKTTRLVGLASTLVQKGFQVYYVCPNHEQAMRVSRRHGHVPCVYTGWHSAIDKLRGAKPGFVLCDEMDDKDIRELMRFVKGGGHVFGGGVRSE
jgi:hypothetical protein